MIGIDSNILLRWLIDETMWPDDSPGQVTAVAKLLDDSSRTFYVNAEVLHETIWVLTKPLKQPKKTILEVLDRLLLSANVEVEHRSAVEAARREFAARKAGFHDCLIAAINAEAGCETTFTFDREASKTPGFTLLTVARAGSR